MAYMNQEKKRALAPQIKAVLKKYGVKGTIGVRHYSTLVVKIKSGSLDLIGNHIKNIKEKYTRPNEEQLANIDNFEVNPYWIHDQYTGKVKDFLLELKAAMNGARASVKNHDNSDIQTDYFDVGWYISINVGSWDRPYIYEK